jgi:hypothetical protein
MRNQLKIKTQPAWAIFKKCNIYYMQRITCLSIHQVFGSLTICTFLFKSLTCFSTQPMHVVMPGRLALSGASSKYLHPMLKNPYMVSYMVNHRIRMRNIMATSESVFEILTNVWPDHQVVSAATGGLALLDSRVLSGVVDCRAVRDESNPYTGFSRAREKPCTRRCSAYVSLREISEAGQLGLGVLDLGDVAGQDLACQWQGCRCPPCLAKQLQSAELGPILAARWLCPASLAWPSACKNLLKACIGVLHGNTLFACRRYAHFGMTNSGQIYDFGLQLHDLYRILV